MRRQQRRQLRARGPAPRLLAAKLGTTHSAPPASLLPSAGVPAPRPPSPLPHAGSPPQAPRVGGAEFSWQAGLRLSGSPSPPSGIPVEAPGDQSNTLPPSLWPNPATAPAPSSQPPPGFQQQQLRGPQPRPPTSPHCTLPCGAAVPGERPGGLGDPGDERLGRLARVLPSRPPRACHLGLSSSPPLRPPGSKPQARSPRVPVPRRPLPGVPCGPQTLPGAAPSVSAVLARAAPEPSPKLAAKLAPPARRPPLTGGKGRCARAQSPRRPPPARCMSPRLGAARWRVLS
ncbi:basic proline-rich protein-like [Kogia breviceps]|uniref:basic proline-rich protein-like n=1 Tax=Kogia breviceps TaxID=27615 RepID=UPI0034D1E418